MLIYNFYSGSTEKNRLTQLDKMSIVLLPMQMLSGSSTPRESMPEWVQDVMLAAPNTHLVELSQAILFRGAGIEVVYKQFLYLFIIGSVLFWISLSRFKKSVA